MGDRRYNKEIRGIGGGGRAMTVCAECKWNMSEEVTKGLTEQFCYEESSNYQTEDGCYHYENRSDEDASIR